MAKKQPKAPEAEVSPFAELLNDHRAKAEAEAAPPPPKKAAAKHTEPAPVPAEKFAEFTSKQVMRAALAMSASDQAKLMQLLTKSLELARLLADLNADD